MDTQKQPSKSLWFRPWSIPAWYYRSFVARPRLARESNRTPAFGGKWLLFILLITLAGGALRASYLDHPMRYDESLTYVQYLPLSPLQIASYYFDVNNHVLHSLCAHEVMRWLGNTPPVLRLPALIAGTVLIPLAAMLAWQITRQRWAAALAAGLIATSNVLVDFSTNARGYTMVCMFVVAMCICTVGIMQNPRRRRLYLAWSIIAILGTYTVPTMLFASLAMAAVLAIDLLQARARRRRILFSRLFATVAVYALGTFVLYLPPIIVTGTEYYDKAKAEVVSYSTNIVGPPANMLHTVWTDWTRDLPMVAVIVIAASLVVCTVEAIRRKRSVWIIPLVVVGVSLIVSYSMPLTPYPRSMLHVLPILLVFAVCGLSLLPKRTVQFAGASVLLVCALISGNLTSQREFLLVEDANTLVDAELVALACGNLPDREFALLMDPATYSVRYYAWQHDMPSPTHPSDENATRALVVVNHTQTIEELLESRGAHLKDYGPPRVFRELPHSTIYTMKRSTTGAVASGSKRGSTMASTVDVPNGSSAKPCP